LRQQLLSVRDRLVMLGYDPAEKPTMTAEETAIALGGGVQAATDPEGDAEFGARTSRREEEH
jgi:hypothetical protein